MKVPDGAGRATLSAESVATLQTGRLLVGSSPDTPTQPVVVAKTTGPIPLTKIAEVDWKAVVPPATSTTPSPAQAAQPTRSHASEATVGAADWTSPSATSVGTPRAAAGTKSLAYTGVTVLGFVVAGIALVDAGLGILFLRRRAKVKA